MRNFASTLVKFSKLSHIQTTIWCPLRWRPPHCGVSRALSYATARDTPKFWAMPVRFGVESIKGINFSAKKH